MSRRFFCLIFLNWKQVQEKINHSSKKIEKEKKERCKKEFKKMKSLVKRKVTFSSKTSKKFFYFCAYSSKNVVNHDASGRKGMLSCFKFLLSRLELIWPISSLKISKMSKKCVFGKKRWESMGQPRRLIIIINILLYLS